MFISEFKEEESLWNVTSASCKNRGARNESFKSLSKLFRISGKKGAQKRKYPSFHPLIKLFLLFPFFFLILFIIEMMVVVVAVSSKLIFLNDKKKLHRKSQPILCLTNYFKVI